MKEWGLRGYWRRVYRTTLAPHPFLKGDTVPREDRWLVAPWTQDKVAMALRAAWREWRDEHRQAFPWCFGTTYDQIRRELLAEQLDAERRRREAAALAAFQDATRGIAILIYRTR